MNDQGQYNDASEDISLKDLILKVKEYSNEVFKHWWLLAIAVILSTAYVLYSRSQHVAKYTAQIKFVVEGHMPSGSGLGGLLGTLGMSKPGQVNPYKVLQASRGSNIFNKIAASKGKDGKFLANKVMDVYELDKVWAEKSPRFEGARIDSTDTSLLQLEIVKKLHFFIYGSAKNTKDALCKLTLDEDTGVYTMTSSTLDADLSMDLSFAMYKELKYFFEDEVFQNQKQLADILKAKADSLRTVRDYKVRELSRFENRNRGFIGKDILAERAILRMEQEVINRSYAEVTANREMTDVGMRDRKPLFIVIDQPFLPLYATPFLLIRSLVLFAMLAIFLATLFVLSRKIYKEIMA